MELARSVDLIDRKSPIPAYQQIASSLISRIVHGEWTPGDKLPPENTLAREYGVSRVTLRQALDLLEQDNIIYKQQGKGAFLQENPNLHVQDLRFPMIARSASPASDKNVTSSNIHIYHDPTPPPEALHQLRITKNNPVIALERLFRREQQILGLNRAWFKACDVPGLKEQGLIDNSISTTLVERYNCEIVKVENWIEATKLDARTAALLESNYAASALQIETVHYIEGLVPIEFSSTLWIGRITRFHLSYQK